MDSEQLHFTDGWEQPTADISVAEMENLIKVYHNKRLDYEDAKRISSEKYSELSEVENKVMAALTATGKKSYKVDGLGLFTKVTKEVVNVPKDLDSKRQLFAWIKEKYGADVLDAMVSINHQSLNSFYNQEAEKEKLNPLFAIPGVASPTTVEVASFRKESK